MHFLTVVYLEEVPLLEMQLSAFAQFGQCDAIRSWAIVANEVDPQRLALCLSAAEDIIQRAGISTTKISLIEPTTLMTPATDAGYVNQQILKIAYATVVPSPSYVVLDAKNFAIKPVSHATHYAIDGRPLMNFITYTDAYQKFVIDYYYDLFSIDVNRRTYNLPTMMTPFVLHRSVCLSLMDACAQFSGETFASFFAHRDYFSEFLLYSTFLVAQEIAFEPLYAPSPQASLTIWPEARIDVDFIKNLPNYIGKDHTYMAFHRRKLLELKAEERREFVAFLRHRRVQCDRLDTIFGGSET